MMQKKRDWTKKRLLCLINWQASKRMMIRLEISFFLLLFILFTSCTAERPYPWLEDLDADKEYLDSGAKPNGS